VLSEIARSMMGMLGVILPVFEQMGEDPLPTIHEVCLLVWLYTRADDVPR
jgi:hypothetical protein